MPSRKSITKTRKPDLAAPKAAVDSLLFDRVARIIEQARTNVVLAVDSHMVLAYWLIGREIVQALQGGKKRVENGKQVLVDLAQKLTDQYGTGFSKASQRSFRQFYPVHTHRAEQIRYPSGGEFAPVPMHHCQGFAFAQSEIDHSTVCKPLPFDSAPIQHTAGNQ